MLEHIRLGPGKRPIVQAILVALTAAILLGVCATAPAMRPRTTPARAAAHDAMISRILARHDAAFLFVAPGVHTAFAGHDRLHRPVALTASGALAVATSAALGAIVLVALAVVAGTRREEARRRRAAATAPAALQRGRLAG
jgi:hypothetical protein